MPRSGNKYALSITDLRMDNSKYKFRIRISVFYFEIKVLQSSIHWPVILWHNDTNVPYEQFFKLYETDLRNLCGMQISANTKPRPTELGWSQHNLSLLQHRTHSPFWLSARVKITTTIPRPSRSTIPRSLTPERSTSCLLVGSRSLDGGQKIMTS